MDNRNILPQKSYYTKKFWHSDCFRWIALALTTV